MNIVKHLEKIFTDNLSEDIGSVKRLKKLLVALKGLGNIGLLTRSFEQLLKELLIDEETNDDLKLQVIETFRKTSCENTRHFFMDIYQNFSQSVEVRISSYQQFMKCPNYILIKDLKNFLMKEHVNQVGSFVWSHLSNLMKVHSSINFKENFIDC
jgi:hypothetical protein